MSLDRSASRAVSETTVELDLVVERAGNRRPDPGDRRRIPFQRGEKFSAQGVLVPALSCFVASGSQMFSGDLEVLQAHGHSLALTGIRMAPWLRHVVSDLLARLTHYAEA